MSSSTMSEVINAAILWGHTLPGHPDPKWNNAITCLPGILGAAQRSTCVIFVPENVMRLMFLAAKSDQVSGCIINIDYELSEALEAMVYMDMDTFLHELEVSGLVESLGEEYDLCHDWIHAELLTAISDSVEGLLDGDLLDEAGIQLE
ncbi:hypothetical protein F5146DRAFT_1002652 [Armillaria mellea]|nr:hypothetical protein F5146DRAFT_1002652 [Armillaria mellea]